MPQPKRTLDGPNPVLELVDAGHLDHDGVCSACGTRWPCESIEHARHLCAQRARAAS